MPVVDSEFHSTPLSVSLAVHTCRAKPIKQLAFRPHSIYPTTLHHNKVLNKTRWETLYKLIVLIVFGVEKESADWEFIALSVASTSIDGYQRVYMEEGASAVSRGNTHTLKLQRPTK